MISMWKDNKYSPALENNIEIKSKNESNLSSTFTEQVTVQQEWLLL